MVFDSLFLILDVQIQARRASEIPALSGAGQVDVTNNHIQQEATGYSGPCGEFRLKQLQADMQ